MSPATIPVMPVLLVMPQGRHSGSAPRQMLMHHLTDIPEFVPPPGHLLIS